MSRDCASHDAYIREEQLAQLLGAVVDKAAPWARKSAEWETELATASAELSALERPMTSLVARG